MRAVALLIRTEEARRATGITEAEVRTAAGWRRGSEALTGLGVRGAGAAVGGSVDLPGGALRKRVYPNADNGGEDCGGDSGGWRREKDGAAAAVLASDRFAPIAAVLSGCGCSRKRTCTSIASRTTPYAATYKKGRTRKQMVLDTASPTVETTAESQLSTTVSEGDF